MASIKVEVGFTIFDGCDVVFKAPCSASAVTNLIVYYPKVSGEITSQTFAFKDANGNDLANINNLFASGAIVKVILDTVNSGVYIVNADTNAYLESKFKETIPPERGGTGNTTLKDSMNALVNSLETGTSTPQDDDYFVSQYAGGGNTTTTYHRRHMSSLWSYIKSKADSVYSTLSHKHSASDITSGTLPASRGGTGNTTLKDSMNALVNSLETGTSTPQDDDYLIAQAAGGGTSNTKYYRRKMSTLWSYIKGKADSLYSTLEELEKLKTVFNSHNHASLKNDSCTVLLTGKFLRPTTDGDVSLGGIDYKWNSFYVNNILADNSIKVGGTNVSLEGHTHSNYSESGHTHSKLAGDNDDIILTGAYLRPSKTNGTITLGGSSYKWNVVYAKTGTINTSDLRQKHNLDTDMDKYISMLDKIEPTSYVLNDDETESRHVGYIAQKVWLAMKESGLEESDFAGFIRDMQDEGSVYTYGLIYSEFIPILHAKIKQLEQRIEEQNQQHKSLEERIEKLEQMLEHNL